jgi:Domain of unknown function (DUF4037)
VAVSGGRVEAVVHELVEAVARDTAVRAVGLSGGARPLPEPGRPAAGDIDLFVYCTEIPAPDRRRAALASLGESVEQVAIGRLEDEHWGQGDSLLAAGVETWLMYFTLADARAELEAVLAGRYLGRSDSYYYPIGRCAMWKAMRALYDPDGFLRSLKARLETYPEALAGVVVAHHVEALGDVEDLERAVQRKDVLFYHFALDLALDHFLQAVFALNREYFPSRKRSESYLQGFRVKPEGCEQRLRQVVALGGEAETLGRSYAAWQELVRDLNSLTAGHVLNIAWPDRYF